MKSERLKKLEIELQDLQQWLKLGLVPKKDLEKHIRDLEAEIAALSLRVYTLEDQAKNTNMPPNWYTPYKLYQPVWCRT